MNSGNLIKTSSSDRDNPKWGPNGLNQMSSYYAKFGTKPITH